MDHKPEQSRQKEESKTQPEDKKIEQALSEAQELFISQPVKEEIISAVEDKLKEYADDIRVKIKLAEYYLAAGKLNESEKLLKEAIDLKNIDYSGWAYRILGEVYIKKGELELAEKYFLLSLENNESRNIEKMCILAALTEVYVKNRKIDEADKTLKQVEELSDKSERALSILERARETL